LPKFCALCAFAILLGLARAGYAADSDKSKAYEPLLPSVTLDGHTSITLDTDKPKASDLDNPPALTPLRDDSFKPYVGLKLT
jgi:hypothetical protein